VWYYESDNNTVAHPTTRIGMAPHEDGSMDAIPRRQFIMFDDSLFPTKKTFEECCVSNPYLGEASSHKI
jgi:hypothetical protein